jgi:hypothetical protein
MLQSEVRRCEMLVDWSLLALSELPVLPAAFSAVTWFVELGGTGSSPNIQSAADFAGDGSRAVGLRIMSIAIGPPSLEPAGASSIAMKAKPKPGEIQGSARSPIRILPVSLARGTRT